MMFHGHPRRHGQVEVIRAVPGAIPAAKQFAGAGAGYRMQCKNVEIKENEKASRGTRIQASGYAPQPGGPSKKGQAGLHRRFLNVITPPI